MAALKNIKLKIQSVNKTRKVTRAMEAVSAVKMQKTQHQVRAVRPYATAALSILERLSGSMDGAGHPLTHEQDGKTCVVVITSDKGLAGALNSSVLRAVERAFRARDLNATNTVVICLGRRGADYFESRGFDVRKRYENVSDDVSVEDMREVSNMIIEAHKEKEIGDCFVAYTNFISTFDQEAIVRQIVPLSVDTISEIVKGIIPTKGVLAEKEEESVAPASYTIEPSPEEVLAELLPRFVSIAIFYALVEAKASEHSARMVAMRSATDKAGEVAHDLTLVYNKARQAAITAEVSEITSGIEAMR